MDEAELLTARGADERGRAFATWLAGRGAAPGDRVVLAVPGDPRSGAHLVAAALGALRAGVIPVVLDARGPADELADLIADAEPVAVLRNPEDLTAATTTRPVADLRLAVAPLGRAMHYTSGTTGRRKGVFSGVLTEVAGAALWAEEQDLWAMRADDVHVVMSPLYHSAPLRFAVATLLTGGSVLFPGRFDVTRFLAACARYRPSTTFTAPAQLLRLREHAATGPTAQAEVAWALSALRLLAHAGAPCPEPVKRWVLGTLADERVWEFYGSTEGQFTACSGGEWRTRPGTVGRARPGRILSVDDDGRIWCAVPEFARFVYWRDPAKTAAAWRETDAGPAFTVGDVGALDPDGYLALLGRRDDLIISGGVNVYPAEVERVLAEVAGVAEVAVFGVDDERWGQRVEAAVRGDVDAGSVLAAAMDRLPPARRPRRVHVVADLPRTATGKILRRELPHLLAGDAAEPDSDL
jgi:long-chain acyl-CoA synthetase